MDGKMAFQAVSACSRLDSLSGRTGSVSGLFSRAVYIVVDDLLVTVTYPGSGNIPLGLIVPGEAAPDLALLQSETEVNFRVGEIDFPGIKRAIDFSKAKKWSSRLDVNVPKGCDISKNLGLIQQELHGHILKNEGLAPVCQYYNRLPEINGMNEMNLFCRTAMPVLSKTTYLWKRGRLHNLPSEIKKLLGLGPGLTPSGDDFLIGMMAVLWLASGLEDKYVNTFRTLAAETGCCEKGKTTQVSDFFIKQASMGSFPEKLQNLLTALASPGSGQIPQHVQELLDLGATSGGDMVAGVLFGGELVFNVRCPSVSWKYQH